MTKKELTTSDIRNGFVQSSVWVPGLHFKDYGAAFDAWLEMVTDEAYETGYDIGYSWGAEPSDDW